MINWKDQHCGLRGASLEKLRLLMPSVFPIVEDLRKVQDRPLVDFVYDVKVHMLMPGQYPCIPNWHCDHVPRDEAGNKHPEWIDETQTMYLWISGDPLPEFKDFVFKAGEWVPFSQSDLHRGTVSRRHCWRGFLRATPKEIHPGAVEDPLRRHSQVYLDARSFTW